MSAAIPVTEEDELLAAELAFGLLDADERAGAERRCATDPGFAAAHRRWQDRAVGLFVAADVAPPPGLWDSILARLPANDDARRARTAASLRRWRWTSAAAAALAIVSTTALLLRPAAAPLPPVAAPVPVAVARPALLAMLASPERPASMAVGYDPAGRRLTVLPSRIAVGSRATELWVIPADGTPRSLGVVAATIPSERIAPAAIAALIAPGATLAVSIEPRGGSPTGKPTGPVILTGPLRTG